MTTASMTTLHGSNILPFVRRAASRDAVSSARDSGQDREIGAAQGATGGLVGLHRRSVSASAYGVVAVTSHIHQQGRLLWAQQGIGCVEGPGGSKVIGRLVSSL